MHTEREGFSTLKKLYFHLLSRYMGYDRGDSFPLNILNQIQIHLVQNRKENCHHDYMIMVTVFLSTF